MVKKRARLEDNDPLSSTDRVLAGFEQISKSASQQSNQSTSQEADVLSGQQAITPDLASPESETASQQDSNITSQQPTMERSSEATLNKETTSQQSDKLTIQQVDNIEKPKLRKSTFQISETVLLQLDQVHLTLQLELGKAIAPYKEVIVEEALVRLLEQFVADRPGLIEVLVSRQKSRDKS
ncbi:MAG: hypothetical protein RLZZ203_969 [Cyanobacteriota bacterium]|jgi:hypothetical protein